MGRTQIGFVSAERLFKPVTRDINSYTTLTLSNDGRSSATVQTKVARTLYFLSGKGDQVVESNTLTGPDQHVASFDWTSEDSVVFSDGTKLWRADRNQSLRTQLFSDPDAAIIDVAACGTRYLVFSWAYHNNTSQVNIWRVDTDGTDLEKLTNGRNDRLPVCSSAANVFGSQVRSVPLTGATPDEIVPNSAISHTLTTGRGLGISPDDKTLAYTVATVISSEAPKSKCKIALLDLATLSSPRLITVDDNIVCDEAKFTPDGNALAYVIRENGVDRLWLQPLNGDRGQRITSRNPGEVLDFRWSPDYKNLAILSGHSDSDAVLLLESEN